MNKAIVFGFVFLVLASFASALDITIELESEGSFGLGEDVTFNYTLIADEGTMITFLPFIDCPSAPMPFMIEETVMLEAGVPYEASFNALTVGAYVETQMCEAYIQIFSPIDQIETMDVEITAEPIFSFSLLTCKDFSCIEKSKVFVQGDTAYFDYSSSVANPSITATLTSPDSSQQQVSFPMSMGLTEIGTYTLTVAATKEGYKDNSASVMFGVIEKEVEIEEEFSTVPVEDSTSNDSSGGTFYTETVVIQNDGPVGDIPSDNVLSPVQDDGSFDTMDSGAEAGKEVAQKEVVIETRVAGPVEDGNYMGKIAIIAGIFFVLVVYLFYRIKKSR